MEEKELKRMKEQYLKNDKIRTEIWERISKLNKLLLNDSVPSVEDNYTPYTEPIGERDIKDWVEDREQIRLIINKLEEEVEKIEEDMHQAYKLIRSHFEPEAKKEIPNRPEVEIIHFAGKEADEFLEE